MKLKILIPLLCIFAVCSGLKCKGQKNMEKKVKIIYVMDPICGWCYGHIENSMKMFDQFKDSVEFEILPGGMWSGENKRVQSVQMMNYFLKHDAAITERTGVKFGSAYLEFIKKHDVVLDSEIPSRAILSFSKVAPELSMRATVEIQKARYFYGKDLNKDETYAEIAKILKVDEKEFFSVFKSPDLIKFTQETFLKASKYAPSYPTLLAEKDDKVYLLEQGFAPYSELESKIATLLK